MLPLHTGSNSHFSINSMSTKTNRNLSTRIMACRRSRSTHNEAVRLPSHLLDIFFHNLITSKNSYTVFYHI